MRLGQRPQEAAAAPAPEESQSGPSGLPPNVREALVQDIFQRIDTKAAVDVDYQDLVPQLEREIGIVANVKRFQINLQEQKRLARELADDMLGIGPLESLLKDDDITDIMVNGPNRVFVERAGAKVTLTDIKFRDEAHVRQIAARIARDVGRRLDEASPMVDARLPDGSRVNVVIPPIALDGTTISIRRFSKFELTLDSLMRFGSISEEMLRFLVLAGKCRLNIIISGGTSSGKTTLLNAISRNINPNERIITIEDSAELKLQQQHVVRLETRPPSIEGAKEVAQRDLVRNALRMRPDRIILGEARDAEAFDLLQAMNTGHDGSLGTLHANSPRDALARLENMILMANYDLPVKAIRTQIVSAVDIVIQVERMVDGVRRVTKISEVTGMEGDTISTQDLFVYEAGDGKGPGSRGQFVCNRVHLNAMDKIKRFGLAHEMRQIFSQM